MANHDLTSLSAVDMAALVKSRTVSAVDLVEAHLTRIDDMNPVINAFCTVAHDQALAAAQSADAAAAKGRALGPLHGLPVALKDLTPTKGIRTTHGSRLFEHWVPDEDATLVKRIKDAGAIVIGKTNTPEFGHKGVTDNLVFGATRNPWNPDCTAGGSSGGSAAAVAAGLVPLAEGSDGAGSIRIPSALCGVYGFKPTYGRVPDVAGPFSSHSPFFHNGPLARTVTDASLLYQVMAGARGIGPFSVPNDGDVLATLSDGIRGLKVACSADLGYFDVRSDVTRACEDAAGVFAGLGCRVDPVDPGLDKDAERHFMTLWRGKLATMYGGLAPKELGLLEPQVQALIAAGQKLSAVDYGRANLARETVWNKLARVYDTYDLVICSTTAVPAFPVDQGPPVAINGKAIDPLIGWFLTYPINLTGHPAASIPCGFSKDGLPIGLQIIGRRLEDALVLRASRALERASPWPLMAPRP